MLSATSVRSGFLVSSSRTIAVPILRRRHVLDTSMSWIFRAFESKLGVHAVMREAQWLFESDSSDLVAIPEHLHKPSVIPAVLQRIVPPIRIEAL